MVLLNLVWHIHKKNPICTPDTTGTRVDKAPVIANTPADVILPLVVILPVDNMLRCDVHTPTPV